MGMYINPRSGTKEEWLKVHTTQEIKPEVFVNFMVYDDVPYDKVVIVWICNGPFTVAGILFSKQEFDYFKRISPNERRWYRILIVDKLAACEVSEEYDEFLGFPWRKRGSIVAKKTGII